MNIQNLLDGVRLRLAAQPVPSGYADRLVEELQLHFDASVQRHLLTGLATQEAQAAALAGLGNEREIVHATLNSLRRESFVGRHRFLSLILLPPLLMTITQVLIAILSVLIMNGALHYRFRINSDFQLKLEMIVVNVIVPLAFLGALWRLGRRNFCGQSYILAACGLLMAWSLYTKMTTHIAAKTPHHSWSPTGYQIFLLLVYCILMINWLMRKNKLGEDQPA